jgi:DNA-binding NarL/FixJ family response regulator
MSCRMLIVEDEFLLAGGLEAWVKQAGHEVCGVVSSASAALFLAKTQKPDIVLMDINLSGPVDGIEAARAIPAHTQLRHRLHHRIQRREHERTGAEDDARSGTSSQADTVVRPGSGMRPRQPVHL